ncbi:hypothetical protein ACIQXF_22535 [Lysinibacillus sp. NPDC097231]|uniref:hypothetical protein n=1 Tax=Lysinibacillus sp. NPDC097231 TaxID=3364142 RepID=UPI0038218CF2
MNVQLGSSNYFSTLKKDESNGLSEDLFFGNKKKKATYEIKKENGYVRHIVTKENGEKVIVREVKLSKKEEKEDSSGDIKDMITQKLATQMLKSFDDRQNQQKFLSTGVAGQKEKEQQISKYTTNI